MFLQKGPLLATLSSLLWVALFCSFCAGEEPVPGAASESQDAAEADTGESPVVEVHGFLQTNNSFRPFRSDDFASQLLTAEQRGQLELEHKSPKWEANVKLDFLYEGVEGDTSTDLREGYLTLYGKNLDLRLGKQIITWGVGDLVYITDVFPKDWAGFITGAPVEYLKKGSTALRANYESKGVGLEAIVIPQFENDTFPSSDRLSFFTPYLQAANRVLDASELPEYGLRLSKTLRGFSSSLYLFSGRDPFPTVHFDPTSSTATTSFGKLRMFGFSTQGNTKAGLLSGELAYYRTDDTAGTNPEVNNPSLKTLMGLERTLKGNETLGFQFTQDWMLHYGAYRRTLPAGFPSRDSVLNTATLRWRDSLHNDTFKPTVFGLYNFNDRDWFVKAEAQVEIRPGVWYVVGAHLFGGGRSYTMFGQFDHDDNVYFSVRYSF